MTPEQFIEWIDKEIAEAERLMDRENRKMEPDQSYCGRMGALEEAKAKFILIPFLDALPFSEPENSFVDGLS